MARYTWYDWSGFKEGVALAFWADAYSNEVEELEDKDRKVLSPGAGGDWMDVLPQTPKAAEKEAKKFTSEFRNVVSERTLHQIDNALDPEDAGHYAAMQAMGHGVDLLDYDIDMDVPDWDPWQLRDDAADTIEDELGE